MPRLRRSANEAPNLAGVPAELRTRLHPVWSAPDHVAAFCGAHGLGWRGDFRGPLTAFDEVARAFAVSRGWVTQYGDSSFKHPHSGLLSHAGVPMFSCSLLVREKHKVLGRDITEAEWEWIADVEQRTLERVRVAGK